MRMKRNPSMGVVTALLVVTILAPGALAQSEAGAWAGVQGNVEVQHAGSWQNAAVGGVVSVGDHLRTGAQSRATIVLRDDSVVDLAPNSELVIEMLDGDESARRFR